ncbi:MAG: quinolinate synthase NadA [Terrisporobacter othiniensis]|uniref:quinolinate synthase NadA n=1 Tax=Terrisporobacter petrolearius TaxID=1460447 RepID=UPI0022E208BF|nr:quinolinate synthase NadA [Terrisporobacter petrolearius]MDU4861800.1 quinolinate synthase NadA [Terrisporobacter othiniensis]MDU6995060.1 quinolinate synthase NadA [Terrisporobacter othiniensis]
MRNILKENILQLKKEKNAIILAHLYEPDEIQEIADYVGDSYYLSKIACDSKEELIIFCGVKFMGESAKILSPHKKIILPATNAGCPMADMASASDLEEIIAKYPNAFKVCYINSSYEVKALCDVSVTSSSALDILKNVPNKEILFLPDRNLGSYISEFFPEKEFILWEGFCPTHERLTSEEVLRAKKDHPNVKILAHPECNKPVRDLADYIGSTSGIINYATKCEDEEFIICTEEGILYELNKRNPNKKFYFPEKMICPNMKKTSLEKVYDALCGKVDEVILDKEISEKALTSLENMHKLGEMVLCGK